MREQPKLWREIHGNEIVKIAREAAEKRRAAAEELARGRGQQQSLLDGTVEPCRGYAVYSDFDDYMEQEIAEGRLKPTGGGWYQHRIKEVLEADGWKRETAYRPTRFYPPGSEE